MIRQATADDAHALTILFLASLKEEDEDYDFPAYPVPPAAGMLGQFIEDAIESGTCCLLIADEDPGIMGYILAHPEYGLPWP